MASLTLCCSSLILLSSTSQNDSIESLSTQQTDIVLWETKMCISLCVTFISAKLLSLSESIHICYKADILILDGTCFRWRMGNNFPVICHLWEEAGFQWQLAKKITGWLDSWKESNMYGNWKRFSQSVQEVLAPHAPQKNPSVIMCQVKAKFGSYMCTI